jgi:NADH-quinone oxidoreductase subunit H
MLNLLFNFLIFPGFLFSAVVGLTAGWIERKVSARLQWRVGPPWHQNFTDIVKLFGKETIVPRGAKWTFLLAPFAGLLALILAAGILGRAIIYPATSFGADIIVVLYLLAIPAIAVIIGASSSSNPLASVGASREIKLFLGYELPLVLAAVVVMVKSKGALRLADILAVQAGSSSHIASWSGALAFIACIFCALAKLGCGLFDICEAEQEIMAGALIEYSGPALAVFKLNRALLLYVLPLFLTVLFLGRNLSPAFMAGKFLLILVIFILLKNTNPRLRVDQAVRFFWGPVSAIAGLAVILSLLGY